MTVRIALAASALLALFAPASAQQPDLRAVFSAPIAIERASPVTEIPISMRAGKLFITATVNGEAREFIFDTGSPTILSKSLADGLSLQPVGRNTGVDANGAHVSMDVAVTDTIALGNVTFRKAPVMVFDYSDLPLSPCFLDNGVIGSEILPGSAWRIDLERGVLQIAASATAFDGGEPALSAPLHDFGYPHAPIVDYAVGDITDKALFDTGSSEEAALFAKVFADKNAQRAIAQGSTTRGRGSEGESAGGRGDVVDLARFDISGLRIGQAPLGPVAATTRSVPPTLLGAGLLARYSVTLDYPGGRFLLEKRTTESPARVRAGYSISFVGSHAQVVQLYDDSGAARAGLKLGDRVTAAHGRSLILSSDNPRCETARWLIETFDPASGGDIVVERDGRPAAVSVPATRAAH